MTSAIPIFRIFDYSKAVGFYVDWLGFKIGYVPKYLQISFRDIIIHLTEYHGDCSPGARVYVAHFEKLKEYHRTLIQKKYKFNRPGLERAYGNPEQQCMEVIDPFGNRISFNETLT